MTYVIKVWPIQHISRTKEVHRLVEWSFADPFLRLMPHTKRNPSFMSPSVARHCELALKAMHRTPTVCSLRIERGTSDGESFAVE